MRLSMDASAFAMMYGFNKPRRTRQEGRAMLNKWAHIRTVVRDAALWVLAWKHTLEWQAHLWAEDYMEELRRK